MARLSDGLAGGCGSNGEVVKFEGGVASVGKFWFESSGEETVGFLVPLKLARVAYEGASMLRRILQASWRKELF